MKNFLFFLVLVLWVSNINAQCTPDPQYVAPGIYPDTSIGLAPAQVGQSYSENITVITPTDTIIDVLGNLIPVTIDSISLMSVSGLPPNFTYLCDPPSCGFPGGTAKCVQLYSVVDPIVSDVGVYNIIFETTSYASNVPIIGTFTQDDVIDYYYIEISDVTAVLNVLDFNDFELKGVYPNPVNKKAKIQFITGIEEEILFSVYNLLGEKIESRSILSSKGINTVYLETSSYSDGIYLYSISNGKKIQVKNMLISQ
tara:strand:+ start:5645 stop:6409 length:765 start_codon:yes stop_codon:yes gene_type:complete